MRKITLSSLVLIGIIALALLVANTAQAQTPTPTTMPTAQPGDIAYNLVACFDMTEGTGKREDFVNPGYGLVLSSGSESENHSVFNALNGAANLFDGTYNLQAESGDASRSYERKFTFADTQSSFTLLIEVLPQAMNANRHWLIGRRPWGSDWEYDLYWDGATSQFVFEIATDAPGTFITVRSDPVLDERWYVLVAWYDAETDTMGLSVNNSDYTTSQPYNQRYTGEKPFIVGGLWPWSLMWHGLIDTTAVWERALTPTERTWMYNTLSGRTCSEITNGSIEPDSSIGNALQDGDMEKPMPDNWFPVGDDGRYDMGRIINHGLLDSLIHGRTRCGNGMQLVGGFSHLLLGDKHYADVHQTFNWPGGKLYYRYSVKASNKDDSNRWIPYRIIISNRWTQQTFIPLAEESIEQTGLNQWIDKNGYYFDIPAGMYDIRLGLGTGRIDNDIVYFDDILLDVVPVGPSCEPQEQEETPTPGAPTASPTPGGAAGQNMITNCGFEHGSVGWILKSGTVIIYDDSNYVHVNNSSLIPGVAQVLSWPGGTAYVKFNTEANYSVSFRHTVTNQVYLATAGQSDYDWQEVKGTVNMPAGTYYLEMHHPSQQGPSGFDNVSVSTGNYADCEPGTHWTATAISTATPNHTPTLPPTKTQQPTSTNAPGGATSTPQPSLTPYPTYTPKPSLAPTRTPAIPPTITQLPTSTLAPTHTPWPTNQPTPTTGAPVMQPPPGYSAPCIRPQNGLDVPDWMEYNRCMALSFFSMSPNAIGTVVAMPKLFDKAEPFGTFKEVTDMSKGLQAQVNSYDWGNTGLPGTKDQPRIEAIIPDANSPYNGGKIDLTKKYSYSLVCHTALGDVFGKWLTPPMCFLFNFLKERGLMPWFQLFINLGAIALLIIYIWNKWIDAGANAE